MFNKQISKAKALYKDRKAVVHQIKRVLIADEILILSVKDTIVDVAGHTSGTAMNLYLLGVGAAMAYPNAIKEDPDITVEFFLSQPTSVAMSQLQRMGHFNQVTQDGES